MSNFIKTKSFNLAVYTKGDPKASRVALVLPGRLDTKDYVHMTSLVDALAVEGFYAISFDPPGSWETDGDVKDYTTTNYIRAIEELVGLLGNKPTFLAGHSRGGSVAMLTAGTNKSISGVALLLANYNEATAPMTGEVKDGIYTTSRSLPPGNDKNGAKKEVSLSLDYFADSKKYSPKNAIQKFAGPKLIVRGAKDDFDDPKTLKIIYDSLSEPKQYLEVDSEHDYRYHPEIVEQVNNAVIDFVHKSMKVK